jgi:hypothetical protein
MRRTLRRDVFMTLDEHIIPDAKDLAKGYA